MSEKNLALAVLSALKDNSGTTTEFMPYEKGEKRLHYDALQTPADFVALGQWLQLEKFKENRVVACQLVSIEDENITPISGRIFFDGTPRDLAVAQGEVWDKHDKMKNGESPSKGDMAIMTRRGDLFLPYESDIVIHDFGAGGHSASGQRHVCIWPKANYFPLPEFFYGEWLSEGRLPSFKDAEAVKTASPQPV